VEYSVQEGEEQVTVESDAENPPPGGELKIKN